METHGGVSRTVSREGWIDRTGRMVMWDRSGREVIPTTWTVIAWLQDGLARMESGSLFGGLRVEYIDRDGKVVWRAC